MDRGLQPARRAGDDDARDEHDPAPADGATRFLSVADEAGTRCVVRVTVGTHAIRALFGAEKPPVPESEWDEAAYVAQRLCAYSEALDAIGRVQPAPAECRRTTDRAHPATTISCPRTGDRVLVDDGPGERVGDELRAGIERAVQRVFADAHAWRRHLLPAYFERHRAWRAVAGSPIQH